MDREIIKRRIKSIRYQLKRKNIACFIVTKPANVTYLTGFLGSDSWSIITKRSVFLLTDSRYKEQAENECPCCLIIERMDSMTEAVAKLIKELKSLQTVTIEKSASLIEFSQLKKAVKARLSSVENIVETVRSSKDSSEISAIKTAASIAAKSLQQTLTYIKPGITESELAGFLDFQIRKLGTTNSFEPIVAFGPNASRPHHQPTTKRLKKKDTLLIDFGAKYKGYCCDITRCFVIGRPSAFYQKVYNTVERAQAAAIKRIKQGVDLIEVDSTAREVIKKSGLPVYGHGSGHGLGLEIHESPFIKAESKDKFKASEVITIEPGIYIPGKLGVRIEDDVLVTDTGCKILTRNCSHSMLLPH